MKSSAYMRKTCWLALICALIALPGYAQEARTHTVQSGQNLYRIGLTYGLSVDEIKALNGLTSNAIEIGQVLIVSKGTAPPEALPPMEIKDGRYTIQPGDTYYVIARRLGIDADSLYFYNDRQSAPLVAGETLLLPKQLGHVTYTVRRGDSLYGVAIQHGVTVAQIKAANDLNRNTLREGEELYIPLNGSTAATRQDGLLPAVSETGQLMAYPPTFAGRLMASGIPYDPAQFYVSHKTLPIGTLVLLTHPVTGRGTFAEVTDRALPNASYMMDSSEAILQQLGLKDDNNQRIEVRIVQ